MIKLVNDLWFHLQNKGFWTWNYGIYLLKWEIYILITFNLISTLFLWNFWFKILKVRVSKFYIKVLVLPIYLLGWFSYWIFGLGKKNISLWVSLDSYLYEDVIFHKLSTFKGCSKGYSSMLTFFGIWFDFKEIYDLIFIKLVG